MNELKKQETEQNKAKEKQLEKVNIAEEKLRKASIIEEKFKEQESLLQESDRLNLLKDSISAKKEKLQFAKIAQQIIPLEEQAVARKIEWKTQVKKLHEQ